MLLPFDAVEFADKYSDHIVFASSTGGGAALAEVWHVIPIEVAALFAALVFVAARVCLERALRRHHERKRVERNRKRNVTRAKRRIHV